MRLNPTAFNRHLNHVGQNLKWRKSWACACLNPDSGAPDPKHQLCQGKGRIWDSSIDIVAGVAQQQTNAEWNATGLFEVGDLVMTVGSDSVAWNIGQFDRIVMLDSTDVFSQPMRHGAPNERLIFAVESLERVFWLDPVTRLQIEGSVPVFDAAGRLSWPNGGEPPMGYTYSLTGTKFDEYFVFQNMPSDRNEHGGAKLPKKVILRKWDLFGR